MANLAKSCPSSTTAISPTPCRIIPFATLVFPRSNAQEELTDTFAHKFRFLAVSALFFVCAAARALSTITDFHSLFQHPTSYQDKWITVRGFVGIDKLGHEYLFLTLREAKEKKYRQSIDLIAAPGLEKGMRLLVDAACADIYGQFNAYGEHGYIPTGYLLSDAGLIRVARVSECPN